MLSRSTTIRLTSSNKRNTRLLTSRHSTQKRSEFNPPEENYFGYLDTQPGAGFFRNLLESKYPIKSIALRIPAMLINIGILIMLKTGYFITYHIDKRGKLKIKEDMKPSHFINKLEKMSDNKYKDQPLICIQNINSNKPWDEYEVRVLYRLDTCNS